MNDPSHLQSSVQPIRVLLIVDSLYWVIGNFARQITINNPEVQATVCSQFALRKTLKHFGKLSLPFHLIHFLCNQSLQQASDQLPTITTLHHMNEKTDIHKFFASDAVMTVSRQWQDFLIEKGIPKEDTFLIPFGIDSTIFHQPKEGERINIRKALKLPTKAFVVGFSGKSTSNLDGRKGLDFFIQSIRKFHSQHPNVATLLIGPGWHHFAKKLRKLGITCIHQAYETDYHKIAKLYHALDIFWVTSRIEGGPVPLLEAMASGLPCISTPVGVALDLIEHKKNGFIAPYNNVEEFLELSMQLHNDLGLRCEMGEAARQTIIQKRSWEQSQEKLEKLYEFAMKKFHSSQTNQTISSENKPFLEWELNTQLTASGSDFFSPSIQIWLQAYEQINGLKMMLKIGEWKAATRLGFQALHTSRRHPRLLKEIISVLFKSKKLASAP